MTEEQDEEELRQILNDMPIGELRQLVELRKIINQSCDSYHGGLQGVLSAVGALMVGQIYGWYVLRLALSTHTYIKYEKILGIKFSKFCPERGRLAHRSWGLKLADGVNDFWGAVNGKIPGKRSSKILEP